MVLVAESDESGLCAAAVAIRAAPDGRQLVGGAYPARRRCVGAAGRVGVDGTAASDQTAAVGGGVSGEEGEAWGNQGAV